MIKLLSSLYSSTEVALCCNSDGAAWALIYTYFCTDFSLLAHGFSNLKRDTDFTSVTVIFQNSSVLNT